MPIDIARIGSFTGARADRFALTLNPAAQPQFFSLIWNGNQVKHTLWDLLPDGGFFENPLDTRSGGSELAISACNAQRLASIHRSGPNGALNFSAWKTGGFFDLSDDLVWENDRDPVLFPFGAEPPPAPMAMAVKSSTGGSGMSSHVPGQSSGTVVAGPPKPLKVVGGIKISIGPKVARCIAASRTAGNQLRLSLWMFDNGGEIKVNVNKPVEVIDGTATAVSLAKVREVWSADHQRVTAVECVTAVRGQNSHLRLARWLITLGTQQTPTSLEKTSEVIVPEAIESVTLVPVESLGAVQIVSAVRLQSGSLKLIAWKMEDSGAVTQLTESTGPAITGLHASPVRGRVFVTALREADSRFKASYWTFPNTAAGSIQHQGDAVEGIIGLTLRCLHRPGTGLHIGDTIVAAQTETGDLQLWRYQVTE